MSIWHHHLSLALALAAAAALAPLAGARAAPQVLGVVTTAEPVPLVCDSDVCLAEFSTFCLQSNRNPPRPGTPYRLAGAEALTLVLTAADGTRRAMPAAGLVTVASARAYMAVRISIPRGRLGALGAVGAAVAVGERVSIVPVPVDDDLWPLSEHEIAFATGPLRAAAANLFDADGTIAGAARIANRLINATPVRGRLSDEGRRELWRRVVGTEPEAAAGPAAESAAAIYGACRNLTEEGSYDTLRQCLEKHHDGLMLDLNSRFWMISGLGS